MLKKLNISFLSLTAVTMLIVSCLDEPDYLTVQKTDLPSIASFQAEQYDAFSLKINWRVPEDNYDLTDGFIIETISLNEETVDNFDSLKLVDNNYRKIILSLSDSALVEQMGKNDSIPLFFIDDSASFKLYNYYRVTIYNDEVESYSVMNNKGVYFDLYPPDSLRFEQPNDYQLKLSWTKSDFAYGYRIERYSENDTILYYTTDTTLIDSSCNPSYNIYADSFSVDGLQPNKEYTYSISSYADKENYLRRESSTTIGTTKLGLIAPMIADSIALNINSIRLYVANNTFIDRFDTLFVLKKENIEWESVDTLMINSLDQIKYNNQYLVDVHTITNAEFKLVIKGKVNALASNVVTKSPLPLAGFNFVEGGNFVNGINGGDTTVSSFYISTYEFTGIDNFPSQKNNYPEDNLSWVNAVLICLILNNQYENDYTFRLPSEVEWEYAAKWNVFLQSGYEFPWQSSTISGENANYMNSGDPYDNGITPTGYYDGNNGTIDSYGNFGVYDMGGNILEWCGSGSLEDDLNEISGTNYIGNDSVKPLRGGGYWHGPELLKTTMRFEYAPEIQVPGFGLRVVMESIE